MNGTRSTSSTSAEELLLFSILDALFTLLVFLYLCCRLWNSSSLLSVSHIAILARIQTYPQET